MWIRDCGRESPCHLGARKLPGASFKGVCLRSEPRKPPGRPVEPRGRRARRVPPPGQRGPSGQRAPWGARDMSLEATQTGGAADGQGRGHPACLCSGKPPWEAEGLGQPAAARGGLRGRGTGSWRVDLEGRAGVSCAARSKGTCAPRARPALTLRTALWLGSGPQGAEPGGSSNCRKSV